MQGANWTYYDNFTSFQCLACAEGCDDCEDASPCIVSLNMVLRSILLVLQCVIIGRSPTKIVYTKYAEIEDCRSACELFLMVWKLFLPAKRKFFQRRAIPNHLRAISIGQELFLSVKSYFYRPRAISSHLRAIPPHLRAIPPHLRALYFSRPMSHFPPEGLQKRIIETNFVADASNLHRIVSLHTRNNVNVRVGIQNSKNCHMRL